MNEYKNEEDVYVLSTCSETFSSLSPPREKHISPDDKSLISLIQTFWHG